MCTQIPTCTHAHTHTSHMHTWTHTPHTCIHAHTHTPVQCWLWTLGVTASCLLTMGAPSGSTAQWDLPPGGEPKLWPRMHWGQRGRRGRCYKALEPKGNFGSHVSPHLWGSKKLSGHTFKKTGDSAGEWGQGQIICMTVTVQLSRCQHAGRWHGQG